MRDFMWKIFLSTGQIGAYLAYCDYCECDRSLVPSVVDNEMLQQI